MKDLNFDTFLEKKERKGISAFIFLLGDENKYLSEMAHWTQALTDQCFIVRLNEEDFHVLDIGKHPKTFFYRNGKEIGHFDGIPTYEFFKQEIRRLTNEK